MTENYVNWILNIGLLIEKLKKQRTIAISQFILHLLASIFLIVVVSSANNSTSLSIVSSALLLISLIVLFPLWILGIVNATNINGITHNSIALIIFAIFPMWFVHWIFAAIELNKYDPNRAFNLYVPPHLNMNMNNMNCPNCQIKQNKKRKLKEDFMNGKITSKKYEDLLKKLDNKKNDKNKNK